MYIYNFFKKNLLSVFVSYDTQYDTVETSWPQRYYSGWEGWAYGLITQSEDEDISEDDQLRKRWKLYYGKR